MSNGKKQTKRQKYQAYVNQARERDVSYSGVFVGSDGNEIETFPIPSPGDYGDAIRRFKEKHGSITFTIREEKFDAG